MTKNIGESEYEGRGTEETGLFDKPDAVQNNGDRLRLGYLHAEGNSPVAPIDHAHFRGAKSLEVLPEGYELPQDFSG